jgi:hypothetical protein
MTTTTGTNRPEDLEYVQINGYDVHVKPKQLVQKHADKVAAQGDGAS